MEIVQNYLTKNPCYTANRKIQVKGLMIHSVGVPQPSAQGFMKQWNDPEYKRACIHAFIEPSGRVYQTLPWDHRGWHCGGSGNNTHIGVEMTEPATIKYTRGAEWEDLNPEKTKEHVMGTYNAAVELFAYLCDKFHLDPLADGVIVSHHEGYGRGIATNHGDPDHLWKKFGLTMNKFRSDIKAAMKGSVTEDVTPPSEYKVRVTANVLNIRDGAGTNYPVVGKIEDKGVYTIVEEKDGWGKLKSGNGWISLSYTTRV